MISVSDSIMDDIKFENFHSAVMKEFLEQDHALERNISYIPTSYNDNKDIQIPVVNKSYKKALECNKCLKVLSSKTNLLRHIRSVHHGLKPFQCDQCIKSFTQKSDLKRHLNLHTKQSSKIDNAALSSTNNTHPHREQKLFKCVYCPKKFILITDLKDHLWLHNQEKPFACDVCPQRFIHKEHMLKHKNLHLINHFENKPFVKKRKSHI